MTAQQVTQEHGTTQPGEFIAWGMRDYALSHEEARKVLLPLDRADSAYVLVGWTIAKPYGENQYQPRPVMFSIKPVHARYSRTPTGWRVYDDGRAFVKAAKTIPEAAEKAVAYAMTSGRGLVQTIEAATEAAQKANMEADSAKKAAALEKAERIARGALVEFKGDGRDSLTIEANGQGQVYVRDGSSLMVLSTEQADALADALRKVAARARLDSRDDDLNESGTEDEVETK